MTIQFYPEATISKWTDVEVSPIRDFGDFAEQCEPHEADYWSVFLRQAAGGTQCIADLPSKKLAYQFAETIENLSQNSNITVTINLGSKAQIVI